MKRRSLAAALYRRILLLLAIAGLAMAGILYMVAVREVRLAADHQLINASRMLFVLMREELDEERREPDRSTPPDATPPLLSAEDREAFRTNPDWGMFVVFRRGVPIAQSQDHGETRPIPMRAGFQNFKAGGTSWRSYGLPVPEYDVLVVVAERSAAHDLAFMPIARRLALPLVVLVIGSAGLLWLALRRSLSEIRRLGADLRARGFADLAPLNREEWPDDLAPVVLSLNRLFARLDHAFELEQAFTDDVAHQLRTPLAAIRVQAQLLRKMAAPDLHPETDQLMAAVDRANDLVSGMLTLARLDATAIERVPTDVCALVADLVAEQVLQLPAQSVAFSVSPDVPVVFETDPAPLKIILSALIENAVRHAGSGGQIAIAITDHGADLHIAVADRGPGIPPEDRERLLRRFERGSPHAPGSGLGLSIAARATTILGGTVGLDGRGDGPGLVVTVRIPAKA